MTNQERRQLLDRFRASGMEGSILDVYQAYGQGRDLIAEHYEQKREQEPEVFTTPQEQQQGLRPYHEAGDMKRSAIFKDVPPNTPFNTHGMKVPINIEKYNEQGHLVESHKSVPPGVSNIPTGPYRGDVIETPAEGYRDGGFLQKGSKRKEAKPAPRQGVRVNYGSIPEHPSTRDYKDDYVMDTTVPVGESTHLYAAETFDGKNWFAFPTLFQDPDGTWVDMSEQYKKDWVPVYEEAKRRGEVIDFGRNKKQALRFGEGSWKGDQ